MAVSKQSGRWDRGVKAGRERKEGGWEGGRLGRREAGKEGSVLTGPH